MNHSSGKDKLADETGNMTSDLKHDRGIYSPKTSVSVVDVTGKNAATQGGINAIAGDILHEGVGHPAGLDDEPSGEMKGVEVDEASSKDIQFSAEDSSKVNEYLDTRSEDANYDYKTIE